MNMHQALKALTVTAALAVGGGLLADVAPASAAPAGQSVTIMSKHDGHLTGFVGFNAGGADEQFVVCDLRPDGISIKGQIKRAGQPVITLGDPTHGEDGCATINLRLAEGTPVEIRINEQGPHTRPAGNWSRWTTARA